MNSSVIGISLYRVPHVGGGDEGRWGETREGEVRTCLGFSEREQGRPADTHRTRVSASAQRCAGELRARCRGWWTTVGHGVREEKRGARLGAGATLTSVVSARRRFAGCAESSSAVTASADRVGELSRSGKP